MLKYLHIENIAVIESADLEPTEGFNTLTGETGAGKSIIIDAINAVLGERTSKELIRNGSDKAMVTAIFSRISTEAEKVLAENGLYPDEEGNLQVQRMLSSSGGSIRINGKPTTDQVLREAAKYLINIHGQHDSQMLLKPENHYIYLDLVADNADCRQNYAAAFKAFTDLRREIKSLETDEDKKYDRIDLLRYQINELEQADIRVGEVEELKKARELMQNSEKVLAHLNDCIYMINGDSDTDGAAAMAGSALSFLEKAAVEELGAEAVKLSSAAESLRSVADNLRTFVTDFTFSKEEMEKTDERLDLLHRMMLKYGNSEEAVLDYLNKAKEELANIEFSEAHLEELEKQLDVAEERLVKAGECLTKTRVDAAEKFSRQVCENLSFMDMNGVEFIVDIKDSRYGKNGKDQVEFLISANAGESVKPLYKVASGGELSRVMLAIKSLVAHKDNVDTLIFDEIDTGISGRAASKVAIQLQKVARLRQVICVTHLAQIAAAGEGHFLIEKSTRQGKTYTDVTLLDEKARIREIARIMSGSDPTENIISSAKELLDRSKYQ